MTSTRKSADAREKDLKLAIYRIQRGRSKLGATTLSIASVAREAGVSTALIHNHYPNVAEMIRDAQGRSSRAQRDDKHHDLNVERGKNQELRKELEGLRAKLSSLASINEVLLDENRTLKAKQRSPKVSTIR
ncbi:TetR family transcriptional regulator [Pseudomonas veronii]|uniref:TetR family transcriptional regulator n=1 Tax=Pseudomonas veronii TaxID=76761 RepID=A0A7Y0ZWI7_PSEVE|nr:TetR family transcriptional regulator [Pseudomonas veronii]NMX99294.1 TetR family transcriptional regulator [Pseudomonas veronii]OPK03383.1 TetR family transcriptional regulator [Pseudomonas veronii]CAD0260735.1 conserved hypothetical protein [Pseudomonas veronii]SEB97814.1 regulatory protein, tetR family [Pseudomonas marginalis]